MGKIVEVKFVLRQVGRLRKRNKMKKQALGCPVRAIVLSFLSVWVMIGQQQSTEPTTPLRSGEASEATMTTPVTGKPRVFLQATSHGNQWNARRDQSMEMSKDFERECPELRITMNQQMADYSVVLNHIEHGFARDNQFQIADKNGDLLTRTKEGGSIRGGVKKACATILADWTNKLEHR
jgi:hypothetical protein